MIDPTHKHINSAPHSPETRDQSVHGQTVRGWCPGALRPMQSGDGLIVRVRPRSGTLKLDAMRAIAVGAQDFGNGIIDLTRRANVQVRGLLEQTLPGIHALLRGNDLLDDTPAIESVRNIMVSPLSGLDPDELFDVHPIARALESRLNSDERLWNLPGKFGFILDSGAHPSLNNECADIRLAAYRDASGSLGFKFGLDRAGGILWIGTTLEHDPEKLTDVLANVAISAIARAASTGTPAQRMRDLSNDAMDAIQKAASRHLSPMDEGCVQDTSDVSKENARHLGLIEFKNAPSVLALATPFGSADATQWITLIDAAKLSGVEELRLSPWRTIYLPLPSKTVAPALLAAAKQSGFISDPTDPILRVDACPGAPACACAMSDTRTHARQLARHLTNNSDIKSVHVSGCAKGCARSKPADLMLTAQADGYAQAHNATPSQQPEIIIPFDQLATYARSQIRST